MPAVHLIDGPDQIPTLDGAVAHYHNLVQHLFVLGHHHVYARLRTHAARNGGIAHIGEFKRVVVRNGDRIGTVDARRNARRGILHQHVHADKRFAAFIDHAARHHRLAIRHERRLLSRRRGLRLLQCRKRHHAILDLPAYARIAEDRIERLFERCILALHIHVGKNSVAERRLI